MLNSLASYPNSRVKPRVATSFTDTVKRIVNGSGEATGVIMPDGGVVTINGNMLVIGADPDRTYVEIRNTSETSDAVFSYTDDINIEQNTLQVGGFKIPAGCSYRFESKSTIYMKSIDAMIAGRVNIDLDIGRG